MCHLTWRTGGRGAQDIASYWLPSALILAVYSVVMYRTRQKGDWDDRVKLRKLDAETAKAKRKAQQQNDELEQQRRAKGAPPPSLLLALSPCAARARPARPRFSTSAQPGSSLVSHTRVGWARAANYMAQQQGQEAPSDEEAEARNEFDDAKSFMSVNAAVQYRAPQAGQSQEVRPSCVLSTGRELSGAVKSVLTRDGDLIDGQVDEKKKRLFGDDAKKASIELGKQLKDRITFDDVAGIGEAKLELMEVRALPLPPPGGGGETTGHGKEPALPCPRTLLLSPSEDSTHSTQGRVPPHPRENATRTGGTAP